MRRIYLETNAVNRARECGLSGTALARILAQQSFQPVVGIHVIYELGRGFLKPEYVNAAKDNFVIVRDLAPAYSLPVKSLFAEEVNRFRTGAAVAPLVGEGDLTRTRTEVARLADGIVSEKGRQFIANREAAFLVDHRRSCARLIKQVKSLKKSHLERIAHLKSFEAVYAQFEPEFPRMLEALLDFKVSVVEAERMLNVLHKFPGIRAGLRANLYFTFVCIHHGKAPSRGLVDDNRHIIEASYCDHFLSEDRALLRRGKHIGPDLVFTPWSDVYMRTDL